jgi:hypothetical protein
MTIYADKIGTLIAKMFAIIPEISKNLQVNRTSVDDYLRTVYGSVNGLRESLSPCIGMKELPSLWM